MMHHLCTILNTFISFVFMTQTATPHTPSPRQGRKIEMKLELPPGPFKAYLFDCDGTIADSMPLHYVAWSKALAEWNCEFTEDLFYAWGGMSVAEIIATLNQERGLIYPRRKLQSEKKNCISKISRSSKRSRKYWNISKPAMAGFVCGCLRSTRDSVTASLGALKLLDKFDVLVCAGDYQKSKPDPEPFLIAAKRLGVAPEDCLVFEDSDMGIQAATAAGMASVKVPESSA